MTRARSCWMSPSESLWAGTASPMSPCCGPSPPIVQIALALLAWMPMLALTGETRRWEPKRLRLRLFSAAAQLVHTGRCHWLHFTARWPWTDVITHAINRLHALPNPG
ncbi:transposase [Streptomyces mirabilis]